MSNTGNSSYADSPPETWYHDDEETLTKVQKWIATRHTAKCVTDVQLLLRDPTGRHDTVRQILAVHCINDHGHGLDLLIELYKSSRFVNEEKIGLSQCIKTKQIQLVTELISSWRDIE